jgi:hypothetical protein
MCVRRLLSELVPIHGVNAYEPSGFARTVGTWKPNQFDLASMSSSASIEALPAESHMP